MENVFKQEKKHSVFSWDSLGDITEGRGDLGCEMPVLVYRLMQFTLLDVLAREYGPDIANYYLRKAGHLAGTEFARNVLDLELETNAFIAALQKKLQELKIGILRMEKYDAETVKHCLTGSYQ